MAMQNDPVCGIQIEDSTTPEKSDYLEQTYYFCSVVRLALGILIQGQQCHIFNIGGGFNGHEKSAGFSPTNQILRI